MIQTYNLKYFVGKGNLIILAITKIFIYLKMPKLIRSKVRSCIHSSKIGFLL